ncbi:hypothetical protein HMPREF2626_06100 [Aerococcus sp. HMSC062A02]|nr:hypothetical protein HMPREF2626_06100 [Aerococcus sp. HMSC062A02]
MTGGKEEKGGFSRSFHFAEVPPFLPLRTRLQGERAGAQSTISPLECGSAAINLQSKIRSVGWRRPIHNQEA